MKDDIWALMQPVETATTEATASSSPLLGAKVMMVDDEPLMTELIQAHLEDEGYTNFVVSNDPRDALAMIRREEPAVLLLDLMMPQKSGFDLLEEIRADGALRFLPVIVLTAATGADSKLRALQLGATDFLSKPVDASELVLRVRNTLAFRQYHDRLLNYDAVTQLPNGRLFGRGIDELVARRELVGGIVATFCVTVPECRRVGLDTSVADAIAKAVARRLERFAADLAARSVFATHSEKAPRVARLGPDAFGMVIEGQQGAEAVEALAVHLVAELSAPVSLGVHEVLPAPWIGIALAPGDGLASAELRRCAELAATHAQSKGVVRYAFSSQELNTKSQERFTLGLQLRGAAQRGELLLHYQPKFDVRRKCIVGVEALVRWQHPQHGLVPPGRFIPLAEELGLIAEIGEWVLQQACADAAAWVRDGLGEFLVSVNVAKPQFQRGDLCHVLRRAMFDSGLPAHQLVVELTESMLMDDVHDSIKLMQELKALGVTLSIDDFGTGYSSLSYLKRFPLDELKVDRSFIIDLPGASADLAIVSTVIELGRRLGMTVTAEGVETEAQLAALRELGCDVVQGFLFSRPVPEPELRRLIQQGGGCCLKRLQAS